MYIWGQAYGMEYPVAEGSIFGHSAARGAISVAAVHATDPSTIASYSSHGPVSITHPVPEVRLKPDITGVSGVTVSGVNFVSPFHGTSASAPHIAAISALLLSAHPGWSRDDVYEAITTTSEDLGDPGWDNVYGHGLARALPAAMLDWQLTVGGTIGTATWTKDASPYIVTDTVTVPAGETLFIEPGVVVTTSRGIPFVVTGSLHAMGTPDEPIVFTGDSWAGVRFQGADSSLLRHVEFSNGLADPGAGGPWSRGGAVYASDTPLRIENSSFSGNAARLGGAIYVEYGTASVEECSFAGNSAAESGGAIASYASTVIVANSTVRGNDAVGDGGGIRADGGDVLLDRCVFAGNTSADGAAAILSGDARMVRCTVVDNVANAGGAAVRSMHGTAQLNSCIVWNNAPAQISDANPAISVAYNDVQGGWPGTGNIDRDPLLADATNGDYGLDAWSPCINRGDPALKHDADGTRADMGALYHAVPDMALTVADIPNDQGGLVLLSWEASELDVDVNRLPHYSIWRALPPGAPRPSTEGVAILVAFVDGVEYAFHHIGDQVAHRDASYTYVAETLYDSSAVADGAHHFRVTAQTSDPDVFLDSFVASGYSLDNISPDAPALLAVTRVGETVSLRWKPNAEPDLGGYRVYRCEDIEEPVDGYTLIGSTSDTTFLDESPGGVALYVIRARDTHDNLSATSNMIGVGIVTGLAEGAGLPAAFTLRRNAPNPFNGITTIRYGVPETDDVALVVHDALGRRVRTLWTGIRAAGYYDAQWDGADDRGRTVASGMYFCRLTGTQGDLVSKMLLLR